MKMVVMLVDDAGGDVPGEDDAGGVFLVKMMLVEILLVKMMLVDNLLVHILSQMTRMTNPLATQVQYLEMNNKELSLTVKKLLIWSNL